MSKAYADMPGGWKWLTGDMSWEDYGGAWFKRLKGSRTYFIVRYENGHEHDKELPRHMFSVVSVNVGEMDAKRLGDILRSCGWRADNGAIVTDFGDVVAKYDDLDTWDRVVVEAALGYGAYAPLADFNGEKHVLRLRAEARREAETLMRDEDARAERLHRPVNQIGSTAAEYARGDIYSALSRPPETLKKKLLRKIMGGTP